MSEAISSLPPRFPLTRVPGTPYHQVAGSSSSTTAQGGISLESKAVPPSAALTQSIAAFLKASKPGIIDRRPSALVDAVKRLTPLAAKSMLSRSDLGVLLDVQARLNDALQPSKGKALSQKVRDQAIQLAHEVDRFIGTGAVLRAQLGHLCDRLEHEASTAGLIGHFRSNFPELIVDHPDPEKVTLTPEGRLRYAEVKQMFDTAHGHHVIRPDGQHMSAHERKVARLIDPSFVSYQQALRAADAATASRRSLIECADIVQSLAHVAPEQVTRERYATTFPGGIDDPRQLVAGQVLKEPGFLFVGGERTQDSGFRMEIELAKGFPVDARPLYGHPGDGDEKMQWISLPGAQFRFDGVTPGDGGKPTYAFTQLSR